MADGCTGGVSGSAEGALHITCEWDEHEAAATAATAAARGGMYVTWQPCPKLPLLEDVRCPQVRAGALTYLVEPQVIATPAQAWPLAASRECAWGRLPAAGNVVCCHSAFGMLAFCTADGAMSLCGTADVKQVQTVPARRSCQAPPPSSVCVLTSARVAWAIDGCVFVADRDLSQTVVSVPCRVADGSCAQITSIVGLFAGCAMAWGTSDGSVYMSLVNMDMPVRRCTPCLGSAVLKLAASADDALLLAVAASGLVRIYDAVGGSAVRDLVREPPKTPRAGQTAWACTAAFAPDSCLCVIGYTDGSVDVWDTHQGMRVGTVHAPPPAEWSYHVTDVCVLPSASSSAAHRNEFVWSSTAAASEPIGSYGYTGIAAGTVSGAILFWPWFRGRGVVLQGQQSTVASQHRRHVPVVSLTGDASTLLCAFADGTLSFAGSSHAAPTGFSRPADDGASHLSADDGRSTEIQPCSGASAAPTGSGASAAPTGSGASVAPSCGTGPSGPTASGGSGTAGDSDGAVRSGSREAPALARPTVAPPTPALPAGRSSDPSTPLGPTSVRKSGEQLGGCTVADQADQAALCREDGGGGGHTGGPCTWTAATATFTDGDEAAAGPSAEGGAGAAGPSTEARGIAGEAAGDSPGTVPRAGYCASSAGGAAAAAAAAASAASVARDRLIAEVVPRAHGVGSGAGAMPVVAALAVRGSAAGARFVVAHGPTVVQYSEDLQETHVLVGPGSANAARMRGGLKSMYASSCGRYVAVFDCAGSLFTFDGRWYMGATALDPDHVRNLTYAQVDEDAAGVIVLFSTRTHLVVVRPRPNRATPATTEFVVETVVMCLAPLPAGGTIYGCIDGTLCSTDVRARAAAGPPRAGTCVGGPDADRAADLEGDLASVLDATESPDAVDASCDILCKLQSTPTHLVPCTVGTRACVLAGCADGHVALMYCDACSRDLSWTAPTGSGAPISALSTCRDAGIYAAGSGEHVYVGSLVHSAVFYQRLTCDAGPVLTVLMYPNSDGATHVAAVSRGGRLHVWDASAPVRLQQGGDAHRVSVTVP